MTAKTKATVLTVSGYGISAAAPLIATATQFPVFVQKGTGATVSGAFILVAIICALPMLWYVHRLKAQNRTIPKPSTPLMIWGIILVASLALYQIIDELIIISASGVGGVVASKVMFFLAKRQITPKSENKAGQLKDIFLEVLNENRE